MGGHELVEAHDHQAVVAELAKEKLNIPLPQVTVARGSLPELAALEPSTVDTVVLNSVVQYFPGIDYLARVLEGAVRAVRPGGAVFVGDVRSLPLLVLLLNQG